MSYKILHDLTSNLVSADSANINAEQESLISVQAVYTDSTPSAKNFVNDDIDAATDEISIASHGFPTGVLGQLTTTGTLPDGLAVATDYFIIKVSDGVIKLSTTYDNAVAGTAVDITGLVSTGTHTFTPTALSAVLKLQSSIDGVTWFDISGKSVTISASGSTLFNVVDFAEPIFRSKLTQTSGQGALTLKVRSFKK